MATEYTREGRARLLGAVRSSNIRSDSVVIYAEEGAQESGSIAIGIGLTCPDDKTTLDTWRAGYFTPDEALQIAGMILSARAEVLSRRDG